MSVRFGRSFLAAAALAASSLDNLSLFAEVCGKCKNWVSVRDGEPIPSEGGAMPLILLFLGWC